MPITLLDGILVGFTLVSAMLAMVRGFSREVLSVISWIAAAAAAFFFYKPVIPYVQPYIDNDKVAMAAAAGIVFIIALIVVTVITMKLADWIIDSRVGALDRTLGFLFGAARGILLVVVAMLFFNWLVAPQQQPSWVITAKSKPLLDNLGSRLVALLPEDADATILDRLRGKPAQGTPAEGEGGAAEDPDAATGGADQTPAEETPATNG